MGRTITYAPTNWGTRTVIGTWAAWRAQLPRLPAEPNLEPTEVVADDQINTANERYGRTTITVVDKDGAEHTETLTGFWYPRLVDGELVCRAFILTDRTEDTRKGQCQVCEEYGTLVQRRDASGISGWVCPSHDGLDIVFA